MRRQGLRTCERALLGGLSGISFLCICGLTTYVGVLAAVSSRGPVRQRTRTSMGVVANITDQPCCGGGAVYQ